MEITASGIARKLRRKYLFALLGWTLLIGISLAWNLHQEADETMLMAVSDARTNINKDILFRKWIAYHGGVYVQTTLNTPPNPYLKVPDRDVVTSSGKMLTLMNPAYALRELQSLSDDVNTKTHITSLKLLNPHNTADDWEAGAMKKFELGAKEVMETKQVDGQTHLRLMRPFIVAQECLKCHEQQGYKVGDIRGGISADVSLAIYKPDQQQRDNVDQLTHGFVWLIGLIGLGVSYRRERYLGNENEKNAAARRENEKQVENLAFYDPLTGLPNRRLMQDRLGQEIASSIRTGKTGAILFIDLDAFKTVNDTLGHAAGDLLLKQVGKRIQSCLRGGDTVSRPGGDEFIVILNDLNEELIEAALQAESIGEKIQAELSLPYQLNSNQCHSTSSIGISLFGGQNVSIEEVMKQADIAMYQAKKEGKNTVRFFDPKMQESINARAELEGELRTAIQQQQFQLYYQIQTDSSHLPCGAEALIRWVHPEKGLISPADFISIAEETGMILEIGNWVLMSACKQIKQWEQDEVTGKLIISVNVSERQFRQVNYVDQVKEIVLQSGIDPHHLKLELTESMLVENIEETIIKMRKLHDIGITLSLDDFGTGYSSLRYLQKLPIDQLKIDQSFVQHINANDSNQNIVLTIIRMALSLRLDVIAEGVETEAQLEFLALRGCQKYQGYLFGRPVPVDQFETSLRSS